MNIHIKQTIWEEIKVGEMTAEQEEALKELVDDEYVTKDDIQYFLDQNEIEIIKSKLLEDSLEGITVEENGDNATVEVYFNGNDQYGYPNFSNGPK